MLVPDMAAHGLEITPSRDIEHEDLPVAVVISGYTKYYPNGLVELTMNGPRGYLTYMTDIELPKTRGASMGIFKFILLWEEHSPLGDYDIHIDKELQPSDTIKIRSSIPERSEDPDVIPGQIEVEPNRAARINAITLTDFDGYLTHVIDGDTIHVRDKNLRYYGDEYIVGKTVQLAAIDGQDVGEPGHFDAIKFMGEFCKDGSIVKVKRDREQPYDIYGRIVADVHCGGKSLNKALVEAGHASIDVESCNTSMLSSEPWVSNQCNRGAQEQPTPALAEDDNIQEDVRQAVQVQSTAEPDVQEPGVSEQDVSEAPVISIPFDPGEHPLVLLAISAGAIATLAVAVKRGRRKRWVSTQQRVTPQQASQQRVTPQQVHPKGFRQGPSRNNPKAPFKGQRPNKPTQLYECPQCHVPTNSPDITYHDPDAKHPLGWMECKCGYRHDFVGGQF
ncbi:MAG: thermonuclease family protein [Gammaproteobacteria bacterium]|nr:thermonuclease family protein [Gammaproteobacteria bacterium]